MSVSVAPRQKVNRESAPDVDELLVRLERRRIDVGHGFAFRCRRRAAIARDAG
jgi:hypothetical protein